MSDRVAREKAEEEARQQALLKKRSKVLQRGLPRPPPTSLNLVRNSLIRADEDKNSFVPPTLIEQADDMVRKELLSLLEHDNVKYPLEEKANKEKKKGIKRTANTKSVDVPIIEDFEENELTEADNIIKEEAGFLRVAMGRESESFDEFVEAHKTCLNDIMYFPTRNGYGLSSVANNMEKIAALQNEFENVKKRVDDDAKKAQRLEQKIKVLTNGYQVRAGNIWSQIEATFNQMDTAGTELECFQALQKQELLAATHRISNLWEEVQKLKDLERILQKRYGGLLQEQERVQNLIDAYLQAKIQEEIAAKNRAREMAEAEAALNQTVTSNLETPETLAFPDEGNSMPVDTRPDEIPSQQMDAVQEHGLDIETVEESTTSYTDSSTVPYPAQEVSTTNEFPVKHVGNSSEDFDSSPSVDETSAVGKFDETSVGKELTDVVDGQEKMTSDFSSIGIAADVLVLNRVTGEDTTIEGQENGMNNVTVTNAQVVQETAQDGTGNGDVL
ncbi:Cell division cycle 5-like protein [Abeliophyllum distichum]|uniref:Cell division cycle 5-like protein n=1 Tax=Abeliophyllum distichum TaxID=126358 RepID=A0ABD1VR88_9LAMI